MTPSNNHFLLLHIGDELPSLYYRKFLQTLVETPSFLTVHTIKLLDVETLQHVLNSINRSIPTTILIFSDQHSSNPPQRELVLGNMKKIAQSLSSSATQNVASNDSPFTIIGLGDWETSIQETMMAWGIAKVYSTASQTPEQLAKHVWNPLSSNESASVKRSTTMNKISHIAIAVKDLDHAIELYTKKLGFHFERIEDVPEQKVKTGFLATDAGEHIELLNPTDPESPIQKYLDKFGEGIHHIAFFVEDIEASLAELKTKEIRLIDEQPRIGAGGHRIAFLHPKALCGTLLEISQ